MLPIIRRTMFLAILLACLADIPARAQKMDFEEYEPRSTLVVSGGTTLTGSSSSRIFLSRILGKRAGRSVQ